MKKNKEIKDSPLLAAESSKDEIAIVNATNNPSSINASSSHLSTGSAIAEPVIGPSEAIDKVPPRINTLKVALLAIFTALGPALSISFIWFPYFELMSLSIFLGGAVLGPLYGMVLASLSAALYEIIATALVGPAIVIFPFKVVAYLLIALLGSVVGRSIPERPTVLWRIFVGVTGGVLAVVFDLIVNLGMIFAMNFTLTSYFATLLFGLPVTAARVATNTILFAFVPDIINRVIGPFLLKKENRGRMVEPIGEN